MGPPPLLPPSLNWNTYLHVLTLSILVLTFPFKAASDPSTIYDYLQLHGLPIGLLPKGITKFSINTTTGQFEVFLDQPCNAKFENQVHYDFNVMGRLSFGRIGELSGVSAQELFLWFPVKGIRVDVPSSGLIYFDVGVVDKQFSLSLFESPPDCTAAQPVDLMLVDGGEPGVWKVPSRSKSKSQILENGGGKRSELRAAS